MLIILLMIYQYSYYQYDCEEEDQESGQTREGSAPPDCYPYIRETWSEYVLKFFKSTRRPKNMQYQLLGEFKLCRASGSKNFVVYPSTKTPFNVIRSKTIPMEKYLESISSAIPRNSQWRAAETTQECIDDLVAMIVTDNLPLTILRRREGFRKFVKVRQIKYVFTYSSPPYCSIACKYPHMSAWGTLFWEFEKKWGNLSRIQPLCPRLLICGRKSQWMDTWVSRFLEYQISLHLTLFLRFVKLKEGILV